MSWDWTEDISKRTFVCCICGDVCTGFGANPDPVDEGEDAECCPVCDWKYVLPARMRQARNQ